MGDPAIQGFTVPAFLAWQREQGQRHELVDGRPVAMAGAQIRHDRVTINAILEIGRQLRSGTTGCDVFTADIGIRTPSGNIRRPEMSVLCPPFGEDAMVSDRPRLILEVLSDSTERVDRFVKLDEYKAMTSVDYILIVDPLRYDVGFWFRDTQRAWQSRLLRDVTAVIEMPSLGLHVSVEALYIGVVPAGQGRPRLSAVE